MAAQDEKRESSIDFTGRAGRQVGDHLKRYLYRKAGMSGDYLQIPPETYRTILCNTF